MIDPQSVAYWSRCLYESKGVFKGDQSTEAVNAPTSVLRRYAAMAHDRRSPSPYGDIYLTELDSLLAPSTRVIEFGCGVGIDSWYMATQGATVTACDIVPANVLVARRLLEPEMGTVVLLTSYEQLLDLGTFDLVYSHGCLHHIPNVDDVLPLLANAVTVGGNVLVMVYTDIFYPEVNAHPEGPYTRGYSTTELARLFSPWGLQCISTRIFMNGCFQWGLFRRV